LISEETFFKNFQNTSSSRRL